MGRQRGANGRAGGLALTGQAPIVKKKKQGKPLSFPSSKKIAAVWVVFGSVRPGTDESGAARRTAPHRTGRAGERNREKAVAGPRSSLFCAGRGAGPSPSARPAIGRARAGGDGRRTRRRLASQRETCCLHYRRRWGVVGRSLHAVIGLAQPARGGSSEEAVAVPRVASWVVFVWPSHITAVPGDFSRPFSGFCGSGTRAPWASAVGSC